MSASDEQEAEPEASGPADSATADGVSEPTERRKQAIAERADDPPIVARMVVEIRSDGTRTIARGAVEDAESGERFAVEAHGTTPIALAASLAKSMFSAPMLARQAVRALLQSRNKKD